MSERNVMNYKNTMHVFLSLTLCEELEEPFCLPAPSPSLKTGLSGHDSRLLKVAPMRPLNPQILVWGPSGDENSWSMSIISQDEKAVIFGLGCLRGFQTRCMSQMGEKGTCHPFKMKIY